MSYSQNGSEISPDTLRPFGREPGLASSSSRATRHRPWPRPWTGIPVDFRSRISEVFVCDDASDDGTYLVGLGYRQLSEHLPITVIRHTRNLGCGGVPVTGR